MLAGYEHHGFRVFAETRPDACTACPFWEHDIEGVTGMCMISGTEIKIDGSQDAQRMDDCVVEMLTDEMKEQERQEEITIAEIEMMTDWDFVKLTKQELKHIKYYSGMEYYLQVLDNLYEIIKETGMKPERALYFAKRGYNAKTVINNGIQIKE